MGTTGARLQSLIGRVRGGRAPGGRREPAPPDWRQTIRSRLMVCAAALGLWTAGIEARLIYLQVFDHADLMDRRRSPAEPDLRASRQARRDLRPPGPRPGLQRRRRHHRGDPDGDRRTRPRSPPQVCAARSTAAPPSAARRIAKNLAKRSSFAYVARQVTPDEAKRVRALALPGITLLKESRRYYPNSELAAHVVGYVGLDNVGLGGIESAYDSQIRGKAGKILIQTDAKRHAIFSRVERPATAGAGVELTIDQYLQHVAERELRIGVEENRAAGGHGDHHGPADRRDPRARELADVQPERLREGRRRRPAEPRDPEPLRAGIHVQDRHRVGGARAAGHHAGDDDRDQPGFDHLPRPQADLRHAPLRPDPVHRRDREVEQRRRDQGRPAAGARSGSATTSRGSGSARRSGPISAARRRASSGTRRS